MDELAQEPDCHCWLVVNNDIWRIGSVDFEWATGKRWIRLWRAEGEGLLAFVSLDTSRVDWDEYCRIGCELLEEEMLRETLHVDAGQTRH